MLRDSQVIPRLNPFFSINLKLCELLPNKIFCVCMLIFKLANITQAIIHLNTYPKPLGLEMMF